MQFSCGDESYCVKNQLREKEIELAIGIHFRLVQTGHWETVKAFSLFLTIMSFLIALKIAKTKK